MAAAVWGLWAPTAAAAVGVGGCPLPCYQHQLAGGVIGEPRHLGVAPLQHAVSDSEHSEVNLFISCTKHSGQQG